MCDHDVIHFLYKGTNGRNKFGKKTQRKVVKRIFTRPKKSPLLRSDDFYGKQGPQCRR